MARPKLAPEAVKARHVIWCDAETWAKVQEVLGAAKPMVIGDPKPQEVVLGDPKPPVMVAPKPEPVVLVAPKPVAPATVRPHVSMLKDKWVKPVKRGSAAGGPDW